MSTIIFNVAIVKKAKGRYVAYAKEFPITAEPASTQRGAIKKLKKAVLRQMEEAAATGALNDLLEDGGYNTDLICFDGATMVARPYNEDTVSVQLTRRLALLDRAKRNATGQERNQP